MATWDPLRHPGLDASQKPADDAGTSNEVTLGGIDNQLADNDVLGAVTSVTPDTLASIEHALDQLTSTTDLFDVPALDFDGGAGS
jgi:hypothetical protein